MRHLSGKRLLPKVFKSQNHIDEIKVVYVPFWLFDAEADANILYRAEKKRRISELESAIKAGQNREIDLRRKVDEFRDLYFEQCDKVKALREHPWENLWSWLKGRFS